MRLAAQAKGGYYPTPPRVVDLVAKLLYGARGRSRSADTLRILDPCCGAGDALAQFADLLRDRGTVPVETCGWNCIGTGQSRRPTAWTAPWPATSSPRR